VTTAQNPTPTMSPEWQQWIADNLLRGVGGRQVADAMAQAGFDQTTAVREVSAAQQHPYLAAAIAAGVGAGAGTQPPAAAGGSEARMKKYAWFLEVARRNAQQATTYGEVPRVRKPSREAFLNDFYSQNKPCIIEGALDGWAALEQWQSPEYLKAKCGDRIVEVQGNRNSDTNYELNSQKLKKEISFGEFVDIVEGAGETNDWYMTANNGGRNLEALRPFWDDITYPDYLTDDKSQGFFWYGPKGIVTPIHHDLTNNFMAQVRGRKLVKIIAPYESAHVYNNRHCFSPVDLFNIDFEQFPQMRDVKVIDVEIGPGDLFFLPVGWWHAVKGLDISMTMTFTNFVYENDFYSFYETYDAI
jgi:Cupin-like domain